MRYFTLLFFAVLSQIISAQGICDSTISISPIPAICEGTGEHQLTASHPGGKFTGPGVYYPGASYLWAKDLNAGTYTIQYTITGPGGCTVSAQRSYNVSPAEEAFVSVNGSINCSNPNSTVLLFASHSGTIQGEWNPLGPTGAAYQGNIVTSKFAGEYQFQSYVLGGGCPAYGYVNVPSTNNSLDIELVSCSNCVQNFTKIRIDTIPNGWYATLGNVTGGFGTQATGCVSILTAGLWRARVYNPSNGCVSQDDLNLSGTVAIPSVNAGTDHTIVCGNTSYLNGSVSQGGPVEYAWSTNNGGFVGTNQVLNCPITKPGTYVLTATNPVTGCSRRDTTVVHPSQTFSTSLAIICAGDTLSGYSEPGNYTDTILTHPFGCFERRMLKLNVFPTIEYGIAVQPDNGQAQGSIEINITDGVAPFIFDWSNGASTAAINGLAAGDYTCTVTDANGCQIIETIGVPLGFSHPISALLQVRIAPNPSNENQGDYEIILNSLIPETAQLMLTDARGRQVNLGTFDLSAGENHIGIQQQLTAGLYSLSAVTLHGMQKLGKLLVFGTE
jgi:hypothetical protein